MNRLFLLAGLVAGASLLSICEGAKAEEKKCSCTGFVQDANGAPIAGADVTLLDWKGDDATGELELKVIGQAVSDAGGAFAIAAKIHPLADAIVVARKNGMACHWAILSQPRSAVVKLRLGKPAAIAGVVVDEANKPIAGAEVRCEPHIQGPGDLIYLPTSAPLEWLRAKTDQDGRFRIEGLPVRSREVLEVSAPGKATMRTEDETYSDEWASLPFAAGEGDARVVMKPEGAIEGKVVEKGTNKPVAGVKVFAGEERVVSPAPVATGADGTFRIGGLTDGTHTVMLVQPVDRLPDWVPVSKEVLVHGGKTQNLTLDLEKGGVVEVTVVGDDSNAPVEGAEVSTTIDVEDEPSATPAVININPNLPNPPPQGVPARNTKDEVPAETSPTIRSMTDKDGIARLRLPKGEYGQFTAKKEQAYAEQQSDGTLKVEGGRTTLLIRLTTPISRYRALFVDANGRPVVDAVVSGSNIPTKFDGQTDANGLYEFASDAADNMVLVRDVERNIAAVGEPANAEEPAKIELVPASTIRGQVVDEAGKGVPLAGVQIEGSPPVEGGNPILGAFGNFHAVADEEGRYEIRAILAGDYQLTAVAYGYGQAVGKVQVSHDGSGPVEAEKLTLLKADLTLAGTVVDDNGKPVPGADIDVSGDNQAERASQTTDGSGKFTIRRLCKGTVTISASMEDKQGTQEVDADKGEVKVVIRKEEAPTEPAMSGEDF